MDIRPGQWHATSPLGGEIINAIIARPDRTLFATDFDGTLAPIVANPPDARPHPASIAALDVLRNQLGQVAIITGREARVAVEIGGFGVDASKPLLVLGQYGVERWSSADGEIVEPDVPANVRAALPEVQAALAAAEAAGHDIKGAFVEDKGRALVVHTRNATDPQGLLDAVEPDLRAVAERHDLFIEPGKFVIEMRGSAFDKGEALAALVAEFDPQVVVFAGDDLGDIPAFEQIRALHDDGRFAASIVATSAERSDLIGHADVVTDGTDGMAAWLTALAAALTLSADTQARGGRA